MTTDKTGDTTGPLDWTHPTATVPGHGLDVNRSASAQERPVIAALLELVGLDRLDVRYRIAPASRGRFRLTGQIRARVVQSCVVTLDPVAAVVVAAFAADFWPAEAVAALTVSQAAAGEQEALAEDAPEPIEHGRIDAGRIVFETLATALDPYPRAPGAEFELPDDASAHGDVATGEKPNNPFAALVRLKRPS